MPIANKLGRKMTSLDRLLPIMSHDPLITWDCEIRGPLTGGGSAGKRLSRHRLLVYLNIEFLINKSQIIGIAESKHATII